MFNNYRGAHHGKSTRRGLLKSGEEEWGRKSGEERVGEEE
jgi:hypothetical protein